MCSYCERAIEEADAEARNEAHEREPDEDDFQFDICPPLPFSPGCGCLRRSSERACLIQAPLAQLRSLERSGR